MSSHKPLNDKSQDISVSASGNTVTGGQPAKGYGVRRIEGDTSTMGTSTASRATGRSTAGWGSSNKYS